jgi:hypothetical protein
MKNAPSRTFVLVGLVVAILLFMHFIPQIKICGVNLRHVDILCDVVPELDGGDTHNVISKPLVPDPKSVAHKGSFREVFPSGIECFKDYSEEKSGGMILFYTALCNIKKLDRPVRIAYFGDSFIEGDIVTADLREMLQNKYGGCGVGWIDCASKTAGFRKSVAQTSDGFISHSVIDHQIDHKSLGINQRYFIPLESAYTQLTCTKYKQHSLSCNISQLYYKCFSPICITATINKNIKHVFNVASSNGKIAAVKVDGNIHKVKWQISNVRARTYIYGCTMDCDKGVVVDNYSMRGASGLALMSVPIATMSSFASLRPYDLIIIHYGLNVANGFDKEAYYMRYQLKMEKVVKYFKSIYPYSSIVVVSVSDRDERINGTFDTAKGIETLSAYQQLVASNTHVVYFNLFNAMGGRGSMKRMVDKKQANYDYTHINFRGGHVIAKYFFDAIEAGKSNYERRKIYEKQ